MTSLIEGVAIALSSVRANKARAALTILGIAIGVMVVMVIASVVRGINTGVTDIVFDPRNPDILYAATHQRHRTVWSLVNGGPETGIYKSLNGGESWRELKKGLPAEDKGKIGLGRSQLWGVVRICVLPS